MRNAEDPKDDKNKTVCALCRHSHSNSKCLLKTVGTLQVVAEESVKLHVESQNRPPVISVDDFDVFVSAQAAMTTSIQVSDTDSD